MDRGSEAGSRYHCPVPSCPKRYKNRRRCSAHGELCIFTYMKEFHSAAQNGNAPVMTLLLADQRVDPSVANRHGFTALMLAVGKGCAKVAQLLLADQRVDPNMADPAHGFTPPIIATQSGDATMVTLLLAHGRVDPNLATKTGVTAVSFAALKGHAKVLELLLADDRTTRTRPPEFAPDGARAAYDAALFNVNNPRLAR